MVLLDVFINNISEKWHTSYCNLNFHCVMICKVGAANMICMVIRPEFDSAQRYT